MKVAIAIVVDGSLTLVYLLSCFEVCLHLLGTVL